MKLKSLTLILAIALGAQAAFAQQSTTDPTVEFNPHWYVLLQGGASYTIGETAFKDLISPAAAINFGYQFNPSLGLRFGASGWQGKGNHVYPIEVYKFNYAQGNVDLVIDLANLIAYNHKRIFNPYIFAGAGAAFGFNNGAAKITSQDPKEYFDYLWPDKVKMISPVGRLGIGANFRLSDAVALTLEVNDNILSDKFNSKKVGHPDFQFNALADKLAAEKAAAEALAAEMRQVNTFFTINSAVISDEEAAKLIRYIDWLKDNPSVRVAIAGHADKGTGNKRINQKLSDQRAAAVKAFLLERGIAESRIVSVVGNGDRIQPFAENDLNRVVISTIE